MDDRALAVRLASLRPLARYVDQEQAVIDLHVSVRRWTLDDGPLALSLHVQVCGDDGFFDEQASDLPAAADEHVVRLQIVHPERWWPAGMGEQKLYTLEATLLAHGEPIDARSVGLGLSSVRRDDDPRRVAGGELLINGRVLDVRSVIAIDPIDERGLLPVGAHALLLIRGHYGPDVLYDAADRAGLLLVQSVPLTPDGRPEAPVPEQIDRLAAHPCLAGWFVGHLGPLAGEVARRIRQLDPTRQVFDRLPGAAA